MVKTQKLPGEESWNNLVRFQGMGQNHKVPRALKHWRYDAFEQVGTL